MSQYNVGAPMERLALDVLGPLSITDNGNKYLLIVADYFTKWPEAYPLPNQEATTVLGMKKTRTTPLHPQSDGMVERFNHTIETQLNVCGPPPPRLGPACTSAPDGISECST